MKKLSYVGNFTIVFKGMMSKLNTRKRTHNKQDDLTNFCIELSHFPKVRDASRK